MSSTIRGWVYAIALAAASVAGPATAQAFDSPGFYQVQQKGRSGPPGVERREPPRDVRPQQPRPDDRRGRMTDDERRALHQDLDKANRELYRRRAQ